VGYTTFAILFGILVYEAVMGESKIINFLFNNRILKFFGKISYGLYVYHWPVYILLFETIQQLLFHISLFNEKTSFITASVVVTIVSILLSFLSYEYFEKSFLKLKNKYS
jgi:peptidoglycan/LPS O-acetylase OafA/YrhL